MKEFEDIQKVIEFGAMKYGKDTWLDPGVLEHRKNCDSMFHHLAEHFAGIEEDHESGLDPLLHLAARALMAYTLKKRNLPYKE